MKIEIQKEKVEIKQHAFKHYVAHEHAGDIREDWAENVKWVAYWYECTGYEGRGEAVIAFKDGKFDDIYMGHCSCYGPWEHGTDPTGRYTQQEMMKRLTDTIKQMQKRDAGDRDINVGVLKAFRYALEYE